MESRWTDIRVKVFGIEEEEGLKIVESMIINEDEIIDYIDV